MNLGLYAVAQAVMRDARRVEKKQCVCCKRVVPIWPHFLGSRFRRGLCSQCKGEVLHGYPCPGKKKAKRRG